MHAHSLYNVLCHSLFNAYVIKCVCYSIQSPEMRDSIDNYVMISIYLSVSATNNKTTNRHHKSREYEVVNYYQPLVVCNNYRIFKHYCIMKINNVRFTLWIQREVCCIIMIIIFFLFTQEQSFIQILNIGMVMVPLYILMSLVLVMKMV